jgi:hypothetical protein
MWRMFVVCGFVGTNGCSQNGVCVWGIEVSSAGTVRLIVGF